MINNKNFNTSNWTGRTPRTLDQAFGCHTQGFEKDVQSMGTVRQWFGYMGLVILCFVLVLIISGGIVLENFL